MSSFVLSRSVHNTISLRGSSCRAGVQISKLITLQSLQHYCKVLSSLSSTTALANHCWNRNKQCPQAKLRGQADTIINHRNIALSELKPTSRQSQCFATSAPHNVKKSEHQRSSKTSRNRASIVATSATKAQEFPSRQSSQLQERYIYVHTSISRWDDVPGGLLFDTGYLDSAPGDKISLSVPLVVSLHATPGSFYDLLPVLEAFVKAGCRVLAPAFPGCGYTEGVTKGYSDVFMHTTSEKAEFVRDFLVSLEVKKVDLLIGQGAGCYPAMRLAGGPDTRDMFKSVAFLSPWPHRDFRAMKQKNLLPFVHDLWERPYYRLFAKAFSRFLDNTRNLSVQERITLAYTLCNAHLGEVGGLAVALDVADFPRVMFCADDDPFVEADLSLELADMLGISPENVHHFAGQLEKGQIEQFPSCYVFDKGGHHLEHSQSGTITAVLFSLLKKIRPRFFNF